MGGLMRDDSAGLGLENRGEPVSGIVGGGLVTRFGETGLSRNERVTALRAEYRALETAEGGQAVTWGDEGSGRRGSVTAGQPYRVGSQDCRAYSHRVVIDDAERTLEGTACRNEDGSWTLLD